MSPPLDVLVVDDEAPARDELAFLLRGRPAIGRVDEAVDAEQCLQRLTRRSVDAVFVDIHMPGLDGLDLARIIARMSPRPSVVFVTAYEEHAVEAFGIEATDFLMKPVRPERLDITVRRLQREGASTPGPETPFSDRVAVAHGDEILLIPAVEIRVAVADGDQVFALTPEHRWPVRATLAELEERLTGHGFMRVHRSYLANLRHVASLESFFNGTYLLKLDGLRDLAIPVSRRHAAALRAAIRL